MKTPEQNAALHVILTNSIAEAQHAGADVKNAAENAAKAFAAGLAAFDSATAEKTA